MEQLKLGFFILTSFFGMEYGRIAADKTTITIYPEKQEIEIIQENLFTVIQSEKDKSIILEQWDKLLYRKERKTSWSKELDSFPVKKMTLMSKKNTVRPHLRFSYLNEKDLQIMGVWYNADKNEFFINHIPEHNIKTKSGRLVDNYWVFKGDSKFSFTIEPFLQMPEKYKKIKIPIGEILKGNKTEY